MGHIPNLEACLIIFGAAVAALLIARLLRLDRLAARLSARRISPPHQVIADLLCLAEAAKASGLARAVTAIPADNRLLASAARLLSAHAPDDASARPVLQAHVDAALGRTPGLVGHALRGVISFTGFAALSAAIILMLMNADDPTAISAGVAIGLLALVAAGAVLHHLARPAVPAADFTYAQELLAGAILIEGLVAIRAGDGPAQVRERIAALLPASFTDGAPLRQAA